MGKIEWKKGFFTKDDNTILLIQQRPNSPAVAYTDNILPFVKEEALSVYVSPGLIEAMENIGCVFHEVEEK